ncbi:L-lactate permease [Haloferax sp. Atlit-10N]|uniref:Glycolate permease glcA n=1 Tax=Haloferax prahovense (strain DSM 18310 / JCM 13924 / TL6) TaxID=1227461 RepID=M0G3F7_HALPT|nr:MULTISPECIES: L-lactate permease [Haloferax]ELZ66082.1 Glycolate permease glcA [Haloferax prahovense DSM 18310]RDZ44727.1 L-lactate permease [Haloferax sp. Atlit-16N]RDZ59493.1 L-lactate permease [Haloferax sp. Atlit-10N]
MASVEILALAASVPIVVAFVLLAGLRWSAARSMGVGWVLATALALTVWHMEPTAWAGAAIYGALEGLNIVLIVFGAILLMNYLEVSGSIETIRWYFRRLERDRRIQLLLIGLGFETIIEGVAGFGTPGALAAPLFIGLGFPPLAAAVFGLFFNAPNPQFGAAGTPIIGGVSQIESILPAAMAGGPFRQLVSAWTGVMTGLTFAFWGLLGVFLLVYWFGDDDERSVLGAARAAAPIAPFALVLGALTGAVQLAVAWFIGPALPDIAAGFAVLAVGVVMADRDVLVPSERWTFPDREGWLDEWLGGLDPSSLDTDEPRKRMPVWMAWAPYVSVALVLLVTRWPTFDLVSVLQGYTVGPYEIFGYETMSWSLAYLYLPGTMPFLPVAVLTGVFYRMDTGEMADAWTESGRQVATAAVTLVVAVSLTQVMIQSSINPTDTVGMMNVLSLVLAEGAGAALPFVAPWIGALGTFVTGSNTTSDILFNALQYNAAADVGLSRALVVAIQNVGGGVGNMISVLNIAAISGVIGIAGREGDILRKVVVPTVVFALFVGAVGSLLVYVVAPGVF